MPLWLYLALLAPILLVTGLFAGCCIRAAAWICRASNASWRRALTAGILLQALGGSVWLALDYMESQAVPLAVLFVPALIGLSGVLIAVKWAARTPWGRSFAVFGVYLVLNTTMAVGVGIFLKRTIYDTYHLPTSGMAPTLVVGDRFMTDRTLFPGRWEIAVFRYPPDPRTILVQRLVGLPGETVELRDGEVYIDGRVCPKPAPLSWLSYDNTMPLALRGGPCHGAEGSPMTLGPDEYFLLGDNTKASYDSRLWPEPALTGNQPGAVPHGMIIGTARVIYSPPGRRRLLR